jgi:Fe-S-cluster-containing hydrogenase component 2
MRELKRCFLACPVEIISRVAKDEKWRKKPMVKLVHCYR